MNSALYTNQVNYYYVSKKILYTNISVLSEILDVVNKLTKFNNLILFIKKA